MYSLRPKEDLKIPGTIIMFGTGGSIEKNKEFEDMFYNPNSGSKPYVWDWDNKPNKTDE